MEKKDKRFIIAFIGIVVLSFVFLYQYTYAKYRKQITGEMQTKIASWNIKLNNETIDNKSTLTNSLTPTFVANEYVKEGVIAPGSKGYFDITINAEEVDVDFTFEVESVVDEDTPLKDLRFTEYELGGTKYSLVDGALTGDLTKNTGDTDIRIYFEWYDESDNEMDNKEDTEYALNEDYTDTKITVKIKFNQKRSA